MLRNILVPGILLLGLCASALAAKPEITVAGFSSAEALQLGERMYREGVLPSGEPMQALVQRDIPVEGTMFSCESCHLRSGLGSAEGTIITLPTNGAKLFRTLHVGAETETSPQRFLLAGPFQGGDIRPPYTEESLAMALWTGFDPNGRELDWTMPRYLLEDRDMEILVHYLKNLSATFSPGVNENELRFATVIAEGVPAEDRSAMLQSLQAVVRDHNSQSRHEEARARKGPFYKQDKFKAYRRFVLDVWELKGPRETWRRQLEDYYAGKPVFALLGGMVTGEWAPVHGFCEDFEIPCIFPVTEAPLIADDDWYTLYFSKGPYQQGVAAANFLLRAAAIPRNRPLVQIVGTSPASRALARGFQETRAKLDLPRAEVVAIDEEKLPGRPFWRKLAERHPGGVFLFWTGPEGLPGAEYLVTSPDRPASLFFSSTLLGGELYALADELRSVAYITHPYRLPEEQAKYLQVTRLWLENRNVPVSDLQIQSRVYFIGWMLTAVVRMMGDDFYRDYFLDVLDMMRDEHYAIAVYPRLSFGPGQRYASKGCYVTQLGSGREPSLVAVSEWVIH